MSVIKILRRPGKENKQLVFVLNGNTLDSQVIDYWNNSLTNKGEFKDEEVNLERVNLYNAIRGYLYGGGINYTHQGSISEKNILRLEHPEAIDTLLELVEKIKKYNNLEKMTHTTEDEEKITKFKGHLTELASAYR